MVLHLTGIRLKQLLSATGKNFELAIALLASALQASLFNYLITACTAAQCSVKGTLARTIFSIDFSTKLFTTK